MDNYILGLSCYYHDSAAALIKNGEIIAAAQEERFSRKKHDSRFPKNAVEYCLKSQGINLSEVKQVAYYEKPLLTFERLLETYLGVAPRGGRSFVAAMQVWLKEKLFLKTQLKENLKEIEIKEQLLRLDLQDLLRKALVVRPTGLTKHVGKIIYILIIVKIYLWQKKQSSQILHLKKSRH